MPRKNHVALVLFSLGLSHLLAGETPPPIDRDFVIDVQAPGLPEKVAFKARSLFNHADYLAGTECNGRLAGSPGEANARKYIVHRLLEIGYDNVRQFPFQFTGDVRMGEKNTLIAKFSGEAEKKFAKRLMPPQLLRYTQKNGQLHDSYAQFELISDFKPMPISQSGSGSGDLVFAGFGISAPEKGYDDYAGVEVKGKVVMAFRGEPEKKDGTRIGGGNDPHAAANVYSDLFYKAGIARDKGAIALLIIDGERGKAPEKKIQVDMIRGGGRRHCGFPLIQVLPDVADAWLSSLEKNSADVKKSVSETLAPSSFAVPGVAVEFQVDIVREKSTDYNLAVALPGTDPKLKDEIVVIGAHYDHLGTGNEFSLADKADMGKIHCGADDNASGVSSVLELADALYENRTALKRTVWIMFFGAEEMGTIGSNDFVKSPPPDFKIANVSAMLNLDMVGRARDDKVLVIGVGSGVGFDALVAESNKDIGLTLKPSQKSNAGSDHLAFEQAGVPILFFFTDTHSDYHKPSDTADKLNVAAQAKVTALAYNAAARLIALPERPKFVKVEQPVMRMGMGGVRLGTLPDYGYEGKGLRISGVAPNSPADKANLKSGDTLIMLGGRKIENINDYMNALAQSKPNIETPLKIIRDGKEMDVKVVPEKKE